MRECWGVYFCAPHRVLVVKVSVGRTLISDFSHAHPAAAVFIPQINVVGHSLWLTGDMSVFSVTVICCLLPRHGTMSWEQTTHCTDSALEMTAETSQWAVKLFLLLEAVSKKRNLQTEREKLIKRSCEIRWGWKEEWGWLNKSVFSSLTKFKHLEIFESFPSIYLWAVQKGCRGQTRKWKHEKKSRHTLWHQL